MTRIVLVHGIAQQFKGPETLLADWYPALSDGVSLASDTRIARHQVSMAFYGDLFRPAGHRGIGMPDLDASDVQDDIERELLLQWWKFTAAREPSVPSPEAPARLRTPNTVQRALNALSHSVFFAGLSERMLIFSARQVRSYFTDPGMRTAVQRRLVARVTPETRVIVAHSLGTVVAYEALCAHPQWRDVALVTLGSPLAVRNLVFDRLIPRPARGNARWPAPVTRWTNVSDEGDAVCSVKSLSPRFGDRISDFFVHNGAAAHDVRPYLSARETGQAIADALTPDHQEPSTGQGDR
ncbi:hypothetical protein [Streptomyces catenulae]|uniref:Alpha/beta hydrolase n=1 Tax=Streptomyces catenulae TaxID=66875 RepID=A0ABV2Z1J3_9ACTN|nr:hypothetical protein [Streptomyces catenulae]